MKKYIFLLAVACICTSCKTQKEKASLNYSEEIIKQVISDMYVASEALKDIEIKYQDSLRKVYISQIETIHNVEIKKIEEDLSSLLNDPGRYHSIHQVAKDSVVSWFNKYNN